MIAATEIVAQKGRGFIQIHNQNVDVAVIVEVPNAEPRLQCGAEIPGPAASTNSSNLPLPRFRKSTLCDFKVYCGCLRLTSRWQCCNFEKSQESGRSGAYCLRLSGQPGQLPDEPDLRPNHHFRRTQRTCPSRIMFIAS